MPMTINTNVSSLNAQRNSTTSAASLSTLAAAPVLGPARQLRQDDAAGLAIADRMNAQVKGINVAIRNANDGISLAQTAEGALSTVNRRALRMRELAVQAQNGTNGTSDQANSSTPNSSSCRRKSPALLNQTKFNGTAIVGASGAGAQVFQVGANNGDTLTITTSAVTTTTGGLTTAALASTAVSDIDAALNTITTSRATYGAAMSRFEFAISNLQISGENQSAARRPHHGRRPRRKPRTCRAPRSCSRPARRWWRKANQLPQNVLSLLLNPAGRRDA